MPNSWLWWPLGKEDGEWDWKYSRGFNFIRFITFISEITVGQIWQCRVRVYVGFFLPIYWKKHVNKKNSSRVSQHWLSGRSPLATWGSEHSVVMEHAGWGACLPGLLSQILTPWLAILRAFFHLPELQFPYLSTTTKITSYIIKISTSLVTFLKS